MADDAATQQSLPNNGRAVDTAARSQTRRTSWRVLRPPSVSTVRCGNQRAAVAEDRRGVRMGCERIFELPSASPPQPTEPEAQDVSARRYRDL